jgi:hypothetical protein
MSGTDTIELKPEERTRCEVWTRVMGYHRPVSAFNTGKRSEHAERQYFVEVPTGQSARRKPSHCTSAQRSAAA